MTNIEPTTQGQSGAIIDEVLAHLLGGVTDEMAWIIMRSARTTFVKETQDFAAAILNLEGESVAYPHELGVTSLCGTPMRPGLDAFDAWFPGDVMITNDPYSTQGMVTHLNDVYVFKPVFIGDELVCFSWAFLHFTDVGGSAPGSIDVCNTEVQQEGLRIRPVKLYEAGSLKEDVWRLFLDNCRIPSHNEGDISALIASVSRGEERIQNLVKRYGLDAVKSSMVAVIERTEASTRSVLGRLPVGEYRFTEYFEDDYVSSVPVRIEVCLHSRGDGTVELDFNGTDPQVRSAINLATGNQKHHPFLSRAIFNYVVTRDPTMHLNSGIFRCIDLVLPEGSLVNSTFPAAVGMRSATSVRIHDVVLGALLQAVPDEVPCGGASQVAITYVSTAEGGEKGNVVVANPVLGGSGASSWGDGVSGTDRALAYLRNVPTEVLEAEAPVTVRRFGLTADSEGAGQYRGGFGIEFEIELTRLGGVVVMRGKERHRFTPWGAFGGSCGSNGNNYEVTRDGIQTYLGKGTMWRQTEPGTRIVLEGPGGGGYGNPCDRDPGMVLNDALNDLVSIERAERVYGVVIVDNRVDIEATRGKRRGARLGVGSKSFDFGPERSAWEKRFNGVQGVISGWVWSLPKELRNHGKEGLYTRLIGESGSEILEEEAVRCAIREVEQGLFNRS